MRRLRMPLLLVAAACGGLLASLALVGTTSHAASVATQATDRAPRWLSYPGTVVAGSRVSFVLDPATSVRCTFVTVGPTGSKTLRSTATSGAYIQLSFIPSQQAANGRWRLSANCLHGLRLRRDAAAAFHVVGAEGTSAVLVKASSLRLTRIAPAKVGTGTFTGAGRGSGCDTGGNPFTDCTASPTSKWCTWWAYDQRPYIYITSVHNGAPAGGWDAWRWAGYAAQYGHFPEGTTPVVGAIAVFSREYFGGPNSGGGGGQYGHVDYVVAVDNAHGRFQTTDHNWGGHPETTTNWHNDSSAIIFIYGGPAGLGPLSQYAGHIVQWDGDTKAQKTAWLVGPDLHRRWIPSSAVYYCLKSQGAPGPDVLPSSILNQLPDLTGVQASCSSPAPAPTPAPSPTTTTTPPPPPQPTTTTAPPPTTTTAPATTTTPPPPPPPTFAETTGGVTHTWTNYTNAGGTEGPTIGSNVTVQIACKLTGFQVADGNTWWYRIAQDPWSNQYYASADAFYNNGQTSGSLHGTPFVDPNVPNC